MRKFSVMQSPGPPMPVIEGAYHWFCTIEEPIDTERVLYIIKSETAHPFFVSLPVLPQISLATEPPVEDWLRFLSLTAQWQRERGATSSITEMVLCPAYQAIIGMGAKAIPLILAQLESEGDEPDQWFWALRVLTEANPVSDEDRGNSLRMAQAWLEWAKNEAHAW